jgi:LuxR family maltose regulon positive regulatory protein
MARHSLVGAVDLAPHFARRVVLARIQAALGRVDQARDELVRLQDEVGGWTPPLSLQGWLSVAEAEIELAAGASGAAVTRLEGSSASGEELPQARVCLATALLANGEPHRAEAVLGPLRARDVPGVDVEIWLLTALVADRLREDNRALDALHQALERARPEGVRRPFVSLGPDHLPRLLERLAQVSSGSAEFAAELLADLRSDLAEEVTVDRLAEPLTDRELSVLRHLPTMMTNGEIADELYVSVNTVKAHLKRIYRKLDVPNRRDAVHRARELGLIIG